MEVKDLNVWEEGIVKILRTFEFLFKNGYDNEELIYGSMVLPSMIFTNKKIRQSVRIVGADFGNKMKGYQIN